MSLSAWLRDYVYIPLGGNRGSKLRTYANLWTVFLLCGLWHGASWNFVIWGAYHGLFLVLERTGPGRILARLPHPLAHLYALVVVLIGWVWFRANSFGEANTMFRGLVGLNGIDWTMSAQIRIVLSPFAVAALVVGTPLALSEWSTLCLREAARWLVGGASLAVCDNAWVMAVLVLCLLEVGANS